MKTNSTYIIEILGQIDIAELNSMSPHAMTALEADGQHTSFTIQTDQSGLMGLLAHLHNLGLQILHVQKAGSIDPAG